MRNRARRLLVVHVRLGVVIWFSALPVAFFHLHRMIGGAARVILMLIGFVYGALIRGSDLRIPGHCHACIGAVTLACMALTLLLPCGRSAARDSAASGGRPTASSSI